MVKSLAEDLRAQLTFLLEPDKGAQVWVQPMPVASTFAVQPDGVIAGRVQGVQHVGDRVWLSAFVKQALK